MTTLQKMNCWTLCAGLLLVLPAQAGEWADWRGPTRNGVSTETGIVSSWSQDGENLLWRQPFIGRSTPVVLDGQACVIGRIGTTIDRQEIVACYDAESGAKNWEHRFNVYHTTVPFQRVGWASLAGDPETGNIYAHGVGGQLFAYDRDGKILWSYHLTERFGHASGYGGRTQTPLVHGDLLILSFVSAGWGEHAPPRHRVYAFDKGNGDLLWVATPGEMVKDMNTQSVPVVATIGGRTLVVYGNADGWIHAVDVRDGSKVWGFHLSKRGINANVLVQGDLVYAVHGEENIDTATMGRVVAFKGTGSGDITGTAEVWRADISAGFPSPAFHGGKLYVVDNSANLYALDGKTGEVAWTQNVGTVGKASPVIADGKIYINETNGRMSILKLENGELLDVERIEMPGEDRDAEIYGSHAIAYGRVYFATEEGVYCLGKPGSKVVVPGRPKPARAGKPGPPLVVPPDVMVEPGGSVDLHVAALDRTGRIARIAKPKWAVEGLKGKIDGSGKLTVEAGGARTGKVSATLKDLTASARVRVIPQLPYTDDFEDLAEGKHRVYWIGAASKFLGGEVDGRKVLVQPPRARGLQRSTTLFGWSDWNNLTVEVEAKGMPTKRRRPDMGVIAGGYILDLQGNDQELEIRSWTSELRMAKDMDFAWEMETWYHLKLSVSVANGKATVRGKVWRSGEDEPADWTITAEDPLPVEAGCAGIVGYAPAPVYYDNLRVRNN